VYAVEKIAGQILEPFTSTASVSDGIVTGAKTFPAGPRFSDPTQSRQIAENF
jgi:hypothetical protein